MKICRRVLSFPHAVLVAACVVLSAILPLGAIADSADANKAKVDPDARPHYLKLSKSIAASRISETVQTLSGIHYTVNPTNGSPATVNYSRIAGTPGGEIAQTYVRNQFQQILGAENVHEESFPVTTPSDQGASIAAGGKTYGLRTLWPNLVRTSTLPVNGISGPLIYAGRGDLRSFNGKTVAGSIVMLDFNCGTRWLNAPRLGARAVVFVEPTETMRGEAESKFVGIPVSIPRFWISRADAAALQSASLTTPGFSVTVKCDNPWQTHTASNIVGIMPGSDPVLRNQVVVIEGYYDSMSVVPSLAPGAESSTGMASMLELARAFKADPPKRTVWFVACGAHFLGMEGVRRFVDKHLEEWQQPSGFDRFKSWASHGSVPLPKGRQEVLLFSGLDLSSQTNGIGIFYKGSFYDYREDIQADFSDIGRVCRENAAKIGQVLGFNSEARFGDGINPVNGKGWRNYLPGRFAFDAEAATMAGGRGVTFASTDDSRQLSDTPKDTPDNVNVANLYRQTQLLACEYWHILNDTNDPTAIPQDSPKSIMPVQEWPNWTRQGLRLGFCKLDGRVLLFDPKKNFVPDQPIADSLAVIANPVKTMAGVRGNLIQDTYSNATDKGGDARFNFVGLPLVISNGSGLRFAPANKLHLAAYHLHDVDDDRWNRGDIDYAPDQGVNGAQNYPTEFDLNSDSKSTQVIVFKCVGTSIFDLIDQEALKSLSGVRIFDGVTDGEPREFGFTLAGNEPGVSYVEDVAVLFSSPNRETRLKVVMDSGPGATRFLLINSKPPLPNLDKDKNLERAQGVGYPVGADNKGAVGGDPSDADTVVQNGSITNTALRVALDMWNIDDFRIHQLSKYKIVNEILTNSKKTGLHDIAKEYIDKALQAYNARDYENFDSYSRAAWAYEARVYPQALATANDVVQGVIFYLFLLIPFAYFLERLLFAKSNLRTQLGYAFVIFLVVFFVFSQIHPAFDLTINPLIILIAFVMLALSVIVSLLVWGKFEEELKALRRTITGVHKADVGKASIAFAAFSLGISNMRRRKERTLLTCITLILLTFTVLSFTSVVNQIRTNKVPGEGKAIYNGVLLRLPDWSALQEPAYRLLNDEFGRKYAVAPRSWFYGTSQGQQTFLTLKRAQSSVDLKGVMGLTPQEAQVSHIDKAIVAGPDNQPEGRWFNASDTYSIIIPKGTADSLGIGPKDVGRVEINFSGLPFQVIGIYDPDKLTGSANGIKDLDNEGLTPVDFSANNGQVQAAGSAAAQTAQQGFQQYTHLDSANVAIVPYNTLINLGGDLRSVAMNLGDKSAVEAVLDTLIKRLDLNLYAGENGSVWRFSALAATKPEGLTTIIIPIIIASLIVLNTMLGAVFERVKEIRTFSSIGLSPSNISMLFIAEAMVYAIIGAVSGYLIGQMVSKIVSTFNLSTGLTLNFSSTSAEISIGVVIAVVMLSTIFPARKASQVASPSLDSTWKVPDPVGDRWEIMLPFAVTGDQSHGITQFLIEWFRSYEEQSVGDFITQGIAGSTYNTEYGQAYRLTGRVWLAPFDLGVSQDITLNTYPTDLEDVFEVQLVIERISGDVSNWMRINRRFMNVLRKQFLIWRTLTQAERDRYLAMEHEYEQHAHPMAGNANAAGSSTVAPAI